jgi:hypothetical protein
MTSSLVVQNPNRELFKSKEMEAASFLSPEHRNVQDHFHCIQMVTIVTEPPHTQGEGTEFTSWCQECQRTWELFLNLYIC